MSLHIDEELAKVLSARIALYRYDTYPAGFEYCNASTYPDCLSYHYLPDSGEIIVTCPWANKDRLSRLGAIELGDCR